MRADAHGHTCSSAARTSSRAASPAPAAVQLAPGELPLPTRPDRDPEAFLDDDYDNFGNSVEYVSPYQGKKQGRGGRQGGGNGKQGGYQGSNANRGARDIGQRARDSLLREPALREPAAVRGSRDSQPVIVHKPSRSDRLPTAEQLDQLEQGNRPRSEKPALLTRNK